MTTPGGNIMQPGVNKSVAKPPMTDQEIRLECAKLAVQSRALPADVIKTATSLYNFVKSGSST